MKKKELKKDINTLNEYIDSIKEETLDILDFYDKYIDSIDPIRTHGGLRNISKRLSNLHDLCTSPMLNSTPKWIKDIATTEEVLRREALVSTSKENLDAQVARYLNDGWEKDGVPELSMNETTGLTLHIQHMKSIYPF